jgi:hypothetical protein
MEPAESLLPFLLLPSAFLNPIECLSSKTATDMDIEAEAHAWRVSIHNPANRVRCLASLDRVRWRIDGYGSHGRQVFIAPLSTTLPRYPTGIDLYIPDQNSQPNALRKLLGSNLTFFTHKGKSLPLSTYLCLALTHWQISMGDWFDTVFAAMPLGSCIVAENLGLQVEETKFRFIPAVTIESNLLGPDDLRSIWSGDGLELPPTIELSRLELQVRLNDCVSVVTIPKLSATKKWICKLNIADPRYLYHEIRILLMLPKHPHLPQRPAFLVSTITRMSCEEKLCGFIINYYEQGNLAQMIDYKRTKGELSLNLQLAWGLQLVLALQAVLESPVRYYTGLKPDNVVFTSKNTLILIDFEQTGNWPTFTAPEIQHIRNLRMLSEATHVPDNIRSRYGDLLAALLPNRRSSEQRYSITPSGYFEEWNILTPSQCESAMIFSLGKMLWCIFEGWSHTQNGIEENYDISCDLEFPEMRLTPIPLQKLILDCTQGLSYGNAGDRVKLTRVGDRIHPQGRFERHRDGEASEIDTLLAAKEIALERLQMMETYLDSKQRFDRGQASDADINILGFPKQPSLAAVRTILELALENMEQEE